MSHNQGEWNLTLITSDQPVALAEFRYLSNEIEGNQIRINIRK